MTYYGKIRSITEPQHIEITSSTVFIANNITPYTEQIEDKQESGYEYDYTSYTKDEYLLLQNQKITDLDEELKAAKILLGVE